MCVANSARSQLAEGLAKQIFPDAEIESAGSNPEKLNLFSIAAMQEIGIDISQQYSKSIDELSPRFIVSLDYVITLCEDEICPSMVSKAKKLRWLLPNPATKKILPKAEMLQRFRKTRDDIQKKLQQFKDELN